MFPFAPSRKAIARVLIAISSLALIVCALSFLHARHVVRTYTRASARVIDVQAQSVGDGETAYYAVFAFIDSGGREHTVRSSIGSSPAQEKLGDIIPVLYPPAQPDRARFGNWDYVWGPTVAAAVSGSVGLVAGLVILFWPELIRRCRKQK